MSEVKTKICSNCGMELLATTEYFHKDSSKKTGLRSHCKKCIKEKRGEYKEYHKEYIKKERKKGKYKYKIYNKERKKDLERKNHLLRKYGLTIEDYNKILYNQNGKCAICGTTQLDKRMKYFSIDHNHKTNEIRGLLCNKCNTFLGSARENPLILAKAIKYLTEGK